MNFALNVPLGSVSFGQISTALCRAVYKKGLAPSIFPVGQGVDLSAQKIDQDFGLWLQSCINKSQKTHLRKNPTVKLWHISNLMESFSESQICVTFLETDSCTETEANVLKNQKTVFVTSNFTKQVMEEQGLTNIKYLDLGFDKDNFYDTKKPYLGESVITFGLFGKLEPVRKRHGKIIQAWAKKYGNKKEYALHCALWNPFIRPEDQQNMINQILGNQRIWNINFLPYMPTNAAFNDTVNSCNIVFGLSGGEGRDLPVFHAVGIGKHCIGLRAHAYLDYLNDDNAVLIDPTSKIKAVDGIFFHENSQYNVGNFYDWDEDAMLNACDIAIERFKANKLNKAGLELQKRTYADNLETILKEI